MDKKLRKKLQKKAGKQFIRGYKIKKGLCRENNSTEMRDFLGRSFDVVK